MEGMSTIAASRHQSYSVEFPSPDAAYSLRSHERNCYMCAVIAILLPLLVLSWTLKSHHTEIIRCPMRDTRLENDVGDTPPIGADFCDSLFDLRKAGNASLVACRICVQRR